MSSPFRPARLPGFTQTPRTSIKALAAMVVWAVAALDGAAAGQQAPARPPAGTQTTRGGDALDTAHMPDPDSATEGSPVTGTRSGSSLRGGTAVSVVVTQALSSGSAHNGDRVQGQLAAPVRTTSGATLAVGTRVAATVVSAAGAGVISSAGVLSLQLTRVGAFPIISDVLAFNGREGHKDVADSNPAKGTQAVVQRGAILQFRVMQQGPGTGLVPGVPPTAGSPAASAGAPPTGSPGAGHPRRPGSTPNKPSTPEVPPPPHP